MDHSSPRATELHIRRLSWLALALSAGACMTTPTNGTTDPASK